MQFRGIARVLKPGSLTSGYGYLPTLRDVCHDVCLLGQIGHENFDVGLQLYFVRNGPISGRTRPPAKMSLNSQLRMSNLTSHSEDCRHVVREGYLVRNTLATFPSLWDWR